MMLRSVDFPLPLGPRRNIRSPRARRSTSMSSTGGSSADHEKRTAESATAVSAVTVILGVEVARPPLAPAPTSASPNWNMRRHYHAMPPHVSVRGDYFPRHRSGTDRSGFAHRLSLGS